MPQVIDDYELGEPLGVGTVGTVYQARHLPTGREVALKLLHPSVSHDPHVAGRFRREIRTLEKLSHPNIVRYFGDGRHGEQLYYAMELVVGGNLKDILLRQGRLDWKDVVEAGWQICSALQHAHNHGIVHRDLKPSNLFLGEDGLLKLGDFGVALDTGSADITDTGLTVGSYPYMAPEQIRGERTISGQTDLYALGCLLYEMLTGEPPFTGLNFAQIFDQHLQKAPPSVRQLNPDCPEELDAIVTSLLQKNPHDRPISAREVQGRLAEVLMVWDEEQDAQPAPLHRNTQGTNGVRPLTLGGEQPILSHLLEEAPSETNLSWTAILGLLVATAGLVWVAARLSN